MTRVHVTEGTLEGELIENVYGGSYYSFKGIPYAQPPIGDLRFKAPQALKPWNGVRSAKKFGQDCYQESFYIKGSSQGSEDCLYLNIYSPDIKPDKLLPVMFWIHGGSFVCGSGSDIFHGPEFLIRHNVVLVTINYRLEVLGFLCLDTEEIPGNAGMKDQVAALRWVNKNIDKFGGDSSNVTIFGGSSGAVSTSYHLVSPMTKGLFKRAIIQSAASTCWWAKSHQPRQRAITFAKQLGFNSEDDDKLCEFFKAIPVQFLANVKAYITLAESIKSWYELYFSIVDEKKFGDNERYFHGNIYENLVNGIHDGVEVITGYTADEGILNIGLESSIENMIVQANTFLEFFTPKHILRNCPINKQLEVGRRIKDFYFGKSKIDARHWKQLCKYYTMEVFVFDIMQWVKICSKKINIYLYKFNCISERNVMLRQLDIGRLTGDEPLVSHGDDYAYIFNAKALSRSLDVNSKTFTMINNMTTLWTNFAKYGNPTPDESMNAKWMPYTEENKRYLHIGNNLASKTEPDEGEIQFWESVFKEFSPSFLASNYK